MLNRAIFLDRDGVINDLSDPKKFITKIDQVKILNRVDKAIKIFNSLGFKTIIITNQPQVARGMCNEKDIEIVNKHITDSLERKGAKIDGVFYCPHHPEKRGDIPKKAMKYRIVCRCRKPNTLMIEQATKKFNLDVENSYMIGDTTSDIKTGKNARCKTILVKTGLGGHDQKFDVEPDYTFSSLLEAAKFIESESKKIKTIILAGGRGERLRPLTDENPKPMLPIAGKPLLQIQIELAKEHGLNSFIICGHYLFKKIRNFFGNGKNYNVNINYRDETTPLGTGGAIKNAEHLINNTFVVIYGDEMIKLNFKKLISFHKKRKALATVVVHETDHPWDSDLVVLDKNKRIKQFLSKKKKNRPPINISKSSIYVLEPETFTFIKKKCDFDSHVLPKLIKKR